MPGKILQVLVNAGDKVEEGQALLVLEAMKMENVIKSTSEGTVSDIPVSPGQAVEKGGLLVAFEA
jgi:biotin carboxyl carrier protein